MALSDSLKRIASRLAPPGEGFGEVAGLRACFLAFFAIHAVISFFYSDTLLASGQDHNVIHYFDAYKHPEWWSHDITDGIFGGLGLVWLLSLTSSIPVALHTFLGIPLEWFYWLEFLLKPALLVYLLYRIAKVYAEGPWLDYAPLFMVVIMNFRILSINLNSYQSNLYINYYAASYLLLFLYGYWMLSRDRRIPLVVSAFLGPLVHASLGLLGGGLLVALAWGRRMPTKVLFAVSAAVALGLAGEMLIIRSVLSGHETLPDAIAWQGITSNGHLYFPFLNPLRFAKTVAFTALLVFVSFRLTGARELRRDVLIAAGFVTLTIAAYFVSVWIEFRPGVQLAPMRSSVLLVLIGIVCLAARSERSPDRLVDRMLFGSVPIGLIYLGMGRLEAILAILLWVPSSLITTISLRRVLTWGLGFACLLGPLSLTRQATHQNQGEIQLQDFIKANFAPGTAFLAWGPYNSGFRTTTKCQLIAPTIGHGIHWNLKSIMDDELVKAGHALGRTPAPTKLYTVDTYRALAHAQTRPITLEQVDLFRESHQPEYLIYPSRLTSPSETWAPLYENHEYRLYDLKTPENPQLPPN